VVSKERLNSISRKGSHSLPCGWNVSDGNRFLLTAMQFSLLFWVSPALVQEARSQSLGIYPDHTTQTEILEGNDCFSNCTILGGIRAGDNLFHSFQKFGVPENTAATFLDQGAGNIFARVSSEASTINGQIAIEGNSNANLFLINPKGITFGSNSSLSLAGSFFATTAESVLFPGDLQFSVEENDVPLLAITAPIGLQFGNTPSPIINRSSTDIAQNTVKDASGLQVRQGRNLSLIGSEVYLQGGSITANSGRVYIGSVGPGSRVSLSNEMTPEYKQETTSFRDVHLSQRSVIDVSGNSGQVSIRGQNILLSEAAAIANSAIGSTAIGNITLTADESVNIDSSVLFFSTLPFSIGFGTDLNITSREVIIENGSLISGGTFSESDGGRISINATESIEIKGRGEALPSLITSSTVGFGRGGSIVMKTKRLTITDGSQVQAITFQSGQGGDIQINANELIDISGSVETPLSTFASGIVASSGRGAMSSATGEGGNLILNTDTLTLKEGAQIAVNSVGNGNSGDIDINARTVQLSDAAKLTAAAALGNGGNIALNGLETLVLRRGSKISTQAGTQGRDGDGGNIDIRADFVVGGPFEDSDIVANAQRGRGGNITINTRGLYGIAERRAIANNGTNDIDASSEFGISGISTVNRIVSEADTAPPSFIRSALAASTEVSQSCGVVGNRFLISGRGGLPVQPNSALELQDSLVDLGEVHSLGSPIGDATYEVAKVPPPSAPPLVEASAWQRDSHNQIRLVASSKQENISDENTAHCTG